MLPVFVSVCVCVSVGIRSVWSSSSSSSSEFKSRARFVRARNVQPYVPPTQQNAYSTAFKVWQYILKRRKKKEKVRWFFFFFFKVVSWIRAHTHCKRREEEEERWLFSYSLLKEENLHDKISVWNLPSLFLVASKRTTHTRVDSCCEKEKCSCSTRATKERIA